MNFLCPSCRTPLPRAAPEHVTCSGCGVSVDLTRVDTAPGQARLWPEIDLSGETLSGYALLRLLGSGGMGSVYEARGPDGAIIALKVLSPLLAAEPALRERFRREARALAALSHPNVVKMLGEGEENSFCWYAMERVMGMDLRERLKTGPLPVPEVIALGKTMLDALEVVHASGFVHRDVKPSNILLSPEGPKLCDFGIARFEGASTLTESAALLGSLRYMAPEQRWGKSDERSDLYALGVVLHEALALGVPGEKPLPASTPASLTRAIARLTEASPVLRPQSAVAAKRLLLASSKRPMLLAASALLCILVAGSYFAINQPVEQTAAVTIDAGVLLAVAGPPREEAVVAIDAGAPAALDTEPDAGPIELALLSPPDAGRADLAAVLGIVRGSPVSTGLETAGLGTKGGRTKGKPVGKKLTKAPTEPVEPDDTQPSKVEKPSKPPAELAPTAKLGVLIIQGSGPATVFDGKTLLGEAPGEFRLALGGHSIFVACKVGGKRQGFKRYLSVKSDSEPVSYECPLAESSK